MPPEEIRKKFGEFVGKDKYKHFVLSIYQSYPWEYGLAYWQEKLLTDFSNEFKIEPIGIENLREIFSLCPIHDYELKNDFIEIVDGNKIIPKISYDVEEEMFPMAYVNAPRDLERMVYVYPTTIEKVYCEKCRDIRKKYHQE